MYVYLNVLLPENKKKSGFSQQTHSVLMNSLKYLLFRITNQFYVYYTEKLIGYIENPYTQLPKDSYLTLVRWLKNVYEILYKIET